MKFRLSMVIKLHAPAPFLVIWRVPPVLEDAHLAAGQDDRRAVIGLSRPDVLAGDRVAHSAKPGNGRAVTAHQVISTRQHGSVIVAYLNIQLSRRAVDQQHIGWIEPATREGDAGRPAIGDPQIPDMACVQPHCCTCFLCC